VYEVFIDNEEGVTLQFCSEVSKQLKPLIDRMTVDSEYRLVVSSPGFERSLKLPWQFGKHVGKLMRVTHSLAEGFEETTGRLVSVDRESIVLRDDTTKVERRFPFSEILDAHLKAPW
jgi:ribosome maturation factor RimP